jgi:phage gp46-like protein
MLPFDDDDRRGWFGDYVDLRPSEFEKPLGSRMWLYERSVLTEMVARSIQREAQAALSVLTRQGAAASIYVDLEWSAENQYVKLRIQIYSKDGTLKYDQRFMRYWKQVHPEISSN